jgi:hypothetical protein
VVGREVQHLGQRTACQLVLGLGLVELLLAGDRLHRRIDDVLFELHVRFERCP